VTSVKQAVNAAIGFVEDLFPEAKGIRLEQVEPHSAVWSVVLSFDTGEPSTLASVMGGEKRIFKAVEIDSLSGEPQALKVWTN